MFQRIKELGKQSVIYGLGGVLNQLVNFVLVPLYSYYLTPGEFAVYELLFRTAQLALIVAQLGLASAIFKSALYDKKSDTRTLYSTAFYTLVGSSLLTVAAGALLAGWLSGLLFDSAEHTRLIWLTFLTAALDTFIVVPMARLRIEGRAFRYSAISFAGFTTRLLLNVLFVAFLQRGVAGLVEANLLQSVLFFFVYLWHIRDQLALRFSTAELRRLLSFSLPTIPALLGSTALVISDRYILNYFRTPDEVGIYSMGYRIALVANMAVQAFQLAWPVLMFSVAETKEAERFYSRVLTYLFWGGNLLALGLSVLAGDILRLFSTPAYYGAAAIIPPVVLSYVFYGAYFATNIGSLLKNKTYWITMIVGISLAVQVGLNLVLIPRTGMMGAAVATVLSYLLMPIMAILISRRYFHVRYEYGRIALTLLVAAGLYGVSLLVRIDNFYLSALVHGLIALVYPLLLWPLGFYQPDEKRRLVELAGQGWALVRQHIWRKAA
ncbi:MAG: oligosaccharide flippase family protein [Anaerolineae bacterium]|nr:oligosaccharide flippase family protein [Anaerolineae bacterium]